MQKISLNGQWEMKILGENVYGIEEVYMPAAVPGSVYSALLALDKMPDPYYRDNELKALKLMENDFLYRTSFTVKEDMLSKDALLLVFEGIDTLADIYLNGEQIGEAYNMHRKWEFDLTELAKVGENELVVQFHSPTKYIKEENAKVYCGGVDDAMSGYPHLRKSHCSFGWDWGPRLPDCGFYRDVYLKIVDAAVLDSIYVTQTHVLEDGDTKGNDDITHRTKPMVKEVVLEFQADLEIYKEEEELSIEVTVVSPDGEIYEQEEDGTIVISAPKLWWPNGYGEQPLYVVKATLLGEDDRVLDIWERKIGLRTMTMNTEKDEWGNKFAHQVNGVDVFAMGADYIPEDCILSRVTKERTRKLIEDCVAANYNCVRVWGGAYYPDDFFYDLCDEYGLMVWQDFMYACSSYELTDDFEANIRQETIEVVRRIRHHACLGLWCGNNEMEDQVINRCWNPSQKQYYDYIKIYEYILPSIVKEEDPNAFYWPSSPSSGGNFDAPWDENRGDAHYWDVWHGNKPFTEYRKFHFRYLSEFGFQSFPSMKTIETFTKEEDRNIFSRVMEMHQRNKAANGKLLNYLSATYLYPKDFDCLTYATQLLQADAIRYGVEHFRRHRGRCMGTVVWQLNDIWPVASWASRDYYGRWKALHYAEKRMFAPVMISCEEIGELSERPFCIEEPKEIEKSARLNVANETFEVVEGKVEWELRDPSGRIMKTGEEKISVEPLSTYWLDKLDFSDEDELGCYFSYRFLVKDEEVSSGTCLFTAPKHFPFENPNLMVTRQGNELIVHADRFARFVEIQGIGDDVKLSDNFFDMNPGEKRITILEGNPMTFRVRSVYDIAK